MKVGIITLPFGANYGWALQRWALYHTIKGLGHEPVIINRKWNTQDNRLTTRFTLIPQNHYKLYFLST